MMRRAIGSIHNYIGAIYPSHPAKIEKENNKYIHEYTHE
jgi:hypothetical protein